MRRSGRGRDDAVPLYHQLFLSLRDGILSGRLVEGATLPTEHDLAAQHDVSRITARRALDELAARGLVERRRRIGTRVTYRGAAAPIEANLEQAVDALIAFGRDTQVKVLSIAEEPADAEAAAALRLQPGDAVVRAVRLRLLDGEPLGQIVSQVPARIGMIDRAALEAKPMLTVLQDLGWKIGGGTQTISALSADPALAADLAIEARAAVLRVERIVTDESGVPILRTVAVYRADRYRIGVDLRGHAISASISAGV